MFSSCIAASFRSIKNKATPVFMSLMMVSAWASASIQYTFTSSSAFDGAAIGSFQITLPTFITSHVQFKASQLDACTISAGVCGLMDFFPDPLVFGGSGDEDVVGFDADGKPNALYYFDNLALQKVGSYNTIYFAGEQQGTLVVAEVGAPAGTVPEPGTIVLLGVGLAGMVASRRKTQG